MAVVETVMNTIDTLMANGQIVLLTVVAQTVCYAGVKFKGWWGKQ